MDLSMLKIDAMKRLTDEKWNCFDVWRKPAFDHSNIEKTSNCCVSWWWRKTNWQKSKHNKRTWNFLQVRGRVKSRHMTVCFGCYKEIRILSSISRSSCMWREKRKDEKNTQNRFLKHLFQKKTFSPKSPHSKWNRPKKKKIQVEFN